MDAYSPQEFSAVHQPQVGSKWKSGNEQPARFTYLPIVDARASRVVGYQAAAADGVVVDCLRQQLMHSPACGLLLMELEAADCLQKGRCQSNHMCALFSQEAWTDRELVIHLHSDPSGSDWPVIQMQKRLQSQGIGFSVNWKGCQSLLSMDALIDARLIRFEASALEAGDDVQAASLSHGLHLARSLGIQTLLTGVSDGEQVEAARSQGFDWLQGPLFNRLKVNREPVA